MKSATIAIRTLWLWVIITAAASLVAAQAVDNKKALTLKGAQSVSLWSTMVAT